MRIRVRVAPHARKEKFEKIGENEYSASVKERALQNEANHRVQTLVARHFNVPLTSVRFLTGHRTKTKTFEVVQ